MSSPLDITTGDFAARLAAEQPTPGGGSAAAYGGALGAALVAMVCRYTLGRERYREVEVEVGELLAEAERLRAGLEQATAADVDAYQGYADAQKLPRETPAQAAARDEALQAALRASTEVPLAVAERAAAIMPLARRAGEIGNRFLVSDAAVGASLALAAFEAATLNVELNAAGLEDAAFAAAARERLRVAGRREDLRELADATYATVAARNG